MRKRGDNKAGEKKVAGSRRCDGMKRSMMRGERRRSKMGAERRRRSRRGEGMKKEGGKIQ